MKKNDITTKDRILYAAEEIFADKGFDGTKVQEIANAAQVNKAMLYYYFKDKDELLYAVVRSVFSGIIDAIPRFLKDDNDTIDDLIEFLEFYMDYIMGNSRLVRIMAWEFLSGKHVEKLAREYIMPIFAVITGRIRQASESDIIRNVSPEHALFSIIGINIFYIMASPLIGVILGGDPLSPERIAERKNEIKAMIINGLKEPGRTDNREDL